MLKLAAINNIEQYIREFKMLFDPWESALILVRLWSMPILTANTSPLIYGWCSFCIDGKSSPSRQHLFRSREKTWWSLLYSRDFSVHCLMLTKNWRLILINCGWLFRGLLISKQLWMLLLNSHSYWLRDFLKVLYTWNPIIATWRAKFVQKT